MPQPQLAIRIAANVAELKQNLLEGKASIEALGPSVEKLAATWAGNSAKLIQNAQNITAAIERFGPAALTAADAARHVKTLDAAMAHLTTTGQPIPPLMEETAEKLRALGQVAQKVALEIPSGVQGLAEATHRVGAAARDAKAPVGDLAGALSKFDGILAALGIHVGPEIRALGEIGAAAGSSASGLALATTAGFVLATAIGSWKLGRLAAEMFDFDEKVGRATAKLLKLGDVAAQEAAAKADVLAFASKNAGRQITDWSEAIAINLAALDKQRAAVAAGAAATDKLAVSTKAASEQAVIDTGIRINNAAQMANLAVQIKAVHEAEEKRQQAAQEAEAAKRLAALQKTVDAEVAFRNVAVDAAEKAAAAQKTHTAELAKTAAEAAKAAAAILAIPHAREYDLSTVEGRRQVPPDIASLLHDGWSFIQAGMLAYAIKMGFAINQNDPMFQQKGPRVPGFASGIENFAGGMAMVGERGPELMYVPPHANIYEHGTGPGGVTNHIAIYVTQPFATPTALANAVDAALMKRGRDRGERN